MVEDKKFYPKLENLGKNCIFWQNVNVLESNQEDQKHSGCTYPKAEMIGRTSCEGVIDDVCIYLLRGRRPGSLSEDQIIKLKFSPPSVSNGFLIPPGDTKI